MVNVPIIYFSVKWWNTLHQGASVSLTAAPKMAATMLTGMLLMALAFWIYAIAVALMRVRAIILERERDADWVRDCAESGMNWHRSEFFAMGGYALYVWGAYGVVALALAVELLLARAARVLRCGDGAGTTSTRSAHETAAQALARSSPASAALGVAAALVLNAFQSNLVFFFTPIAGGRATRRRRAAPFRIGGLVETGSVQRDRRRRRCASS